MEINDLDFPENFFVYMKNLHSYNLVSYKFPENHTEIINNEGDINITKCHYNYVLTEFGKLFAEACIPEK